MLKRSRGLSFAFTAVVYAVAFAAGLFVWRRVGDGMALRVFVADIAATLVLYFVSLFIQNASVYDPYWSVAPVVILPLMISRLDAWNSGSILLLVCVLYWGVRLTANWAYTFRGYAHQDWRYSMLREKSGALYPLVSLFGIMLFPTLVVYLCMLPALMYIQSGGINALTGLGFALCLSAATLQLVADVQLHRFQARAKTRGELIRSGVWRHARHPNYLGEILMWWGVYAVMLSVRPDLWLFGVGALVNTMMFLLISIPMAETRLKQYKSGFADYRAQTNSLLPFELRRAR